MLTARAGGEKTLVPYDQLRAAGLLRLGALDVKEQRARITLQGAGHADREIDVGAGLESELAAIEPKPGGAAQHAENVALRARWGPFRTAVESKPLDVQTFGVDLSAERLRAFQRFAAALPCVPANLVAQLGHDRERSRVRQHRQGHLLQYALREAAQRTPERLAVSCGPKTLTYGELEQRSDQIAALLQAAGVVRGDLVAVCLSKSPETIACWLGALKAGAAYAPLDAGGSAPRLNSIIEDQRPRVLIAPASRPELLTQGAQVTVVSDLPSTAPFDLSSAAGRPQLVTATDEDLAYVYFTSGSTGRPKGVMIQHRASRAYLEASEALLQVRDSDSVGNHAPLAFDLASFDVMLALRAGIPVHLVPEAATVLPGSILKWLADFQPTILYTVPTTLNRLAALASIATQRFPSLRALLFAGEPPNAAALRTLRPVFPEATFHHWYGSTEAALVSAVSFEPGAPLPDLLPLGQPVSNVEIAVWDEERQEISPATHGGELLVAGTMLFSGYRRADDLSSAAFRELRSDTGPTRRWFHTRDVVRVDEQGQLHYVGRNDRMVKVQGFRADLHEVEAVLASLPGVHQAAVVAIKDNRTGARLLAFYVGVASSAELRAALQARLPGYMVPEKSVALDALPTRSTGKVDYLELQRRAEIA